MVTTFTTVVPPAVLPPGSTIIVSLGTPVVIALLLAALIVFGAVLLQGALSAPSKRAPALRAVPTAAASVPSRHAA